jgi:cytoskeleton protein RodZ
VTPQAFGQKLRREREKRKLTLDQLAARTKIAASLFRSLEAGDCARWPGGIYSRGFVRAYATAVGLDPEEIVALFIDSYPAFAPAADPLQEEAAVPEPLSAMDRVKAAVAELFRVAADTRR